MKYELTYLISPNLSPEEVENFSKNIEAQVSKIGEILPLEKPRKIRLAYPIEKKGEAFLQVFGFKSEPKKVLEFKETLGKEQNILRYLLIKKRERPERLTGRTKEFVKKPITEKKVELKEVEKEIEKIT